MFVSVYTTASMWRPEDSCGVGSLDRVDSGDWTQALRLGGKHFYPLSHLTPSYARVAILSQSYPPSPPLSLSLSWFVVCCGLCFCFSDKASHQSSGRPGLRACLAAGMCHLTYSAFSST